MRRSLRNAYFPALIITLMSLIGQSLVAGDAVSPNKKEQPSTQMNCGARIECVTPDGHVGQVAKAPADDPDAAALIMEDDTVTCLLQEGETSFVIELPQTASLDHFTFLNENGNARGELKIAISNRRLSAGSADWVPVDGIIPFSHKRLFGVSLLGIEAKFLRLSFHVEKQGRIAARANYNKVESDPTAHDPVAFLTSNLFDIPALDEALSSSVTKEQTREAVLLSVTNPSVGPLSR